MKVGFSGTRNGMTAKQAITAGDLLDEEMPEEFHHGDCLGSDKELHGIVRVMGFPKIVIWPPINPEFRAWCEADVLKEMQAYLKRNRSIVNATDRLIATPKSTVQRGGTWYTINFALSKRRLVYIVWPDGSVTS